MRMQRTIVLGVVSLLLMAALSGMGMAATKITFLGYGPPSQYGNGLQAVVDKFNATQSDVEVELLTGVSPDKVLTMYAGGKAPDLIYYHTTEQFVRAGAIIPIDRYLDKTQVDDWIPGSIRWHTYDGKTYGAPYGLLGQRMVFYDRDRLAEFGIQDPQEGWTWDDLDRLARKATRDTDSNGETDVYGFDMRPEWFFWPFLINNGSVLYDGEKWYPDPERATEALQFLVSMAREGTMIRSTEGGGGGFKNFAARKVVSYAASSRDTQQFRLNPVDFDIGVVHFPVKRSRGIIVTPRAFYLGNTGNPEKQDAAWKFVKFALQPEQQVTFLVEGSLLPSTLSGMKAAVPYIEENDPLLVPFANEIANHAYPYPFVAAFGAVAGITSEWSTKAINGEVSAKEAATQIIHLSNAKEQELNQE